MKLTLRDLFWLILVVGMAVGWWVDRSRMAEDAGKWQDWLRAVEKKARNYEPPQLFKP